MKHLTHLLLSTFLAGGSTLPAATPAAKTEPAAVSEEVIKVQFGPRSSAMSNIEKKQLRDRLKLKVAANAAPRVLIYAWGDKSSDESGVKAGDRDNQTQAELAENRAAVIRETLQGLGARNIEVFNAAREPLGTGKASGKSAPLPAGMQKDSFSQVVIVFDHTKS